jgi:hypothetical protein
MSEKQDQPVGGWAQILESVKTPLSIFALAVLAASAVLASLAFRADREDLSSFLWIMAGLLALALVTVTILLVFRPDALLARAGGPSHGAGDSSEKYDIFISTPMSGLERTSYVAHRQGVLDVIDALRTHCGFKEVYCDIARFPKQKRFEANDVAFDRDLEAIRGSKRFVLIYPEAAPSGALVEVGMALALRKPAVIWARNPAELPFILQKLPRTYDYDSFGDIIRHLRDNQAGAFGVRA